MLPETPVVRDRLMGFLVQPGCKHQSAAREARSQCPKHMVIKAIDIQEWIFATCNVPIWITRLRPIACRREHIVVLQRQPCVRGNPLDPWLEFVVFLFRNGPAISVLTEQSTELWQLAASDIVFQVLEADLNPTKSKGEDLAEVGRIDKFKSRPRSISNFTTAVFKRGSKSFLN